MFLIVKEDESFYPMSVCLSGAGAQVAEGRSCWDLVEEFWFVHGGQFCSLSFGSLSRSYAVLCCRSAA